MGKASRNKRVSAREKIAAQQAAARRAQQRHRLYVTGGSILGVIAVVLGFVVYRATASGGTTSPGTGTALPASVITEVTHVPAATLDAVAAGQGQSNKPQPLKGSPLTVGGKPDVLYIGAEYCPFCAAERWSMTIALSRFGTFTGLTGIHSSSTDIYPSTPTLTFYKSTYKSKYLTFSPVEEQTVSHATLQTPTAAQQALFSKYDFPPYVTSAVAGAIPFIDVGNQYGLLGGSSYVPSVLAGHTWAQVAAALSKPSSSIAKEVDGAANNLTAAICKATKDQPANVCGSSMIKTLQGKL